MNLLNLREKVGSSSLLEELFQTFLPNAIIEKLKIELDMKSLDKTNLIFEAMS